MTEKFQNLYRVESARLKNWDYRSNAAYFITICTAGREHHFGVIENGHMCLSDTGRIVEKCWKQIPLHFAYARIDEFVIMPNHVHGIIILNYMDFVVNMDRDTEHHPDTLLHHPDIPLQHPEPPKPGSLSLVIRSYKSAVTGAARELNPGFKWQAGFHDSIIRCGVSLYRIRNYIKMNVANWPHDEFNRLG